MLEQQVTDIASSPSGNNVPLPHKEGGRECNTLSSHDAFRHGGLGKVAGQVYELLLRRPLTAAEIVQETGRSARSVRNSLRRMRSITDPSSGELLPMVEEVSGRWAASKVDLNKVAEIFGTAGIGERQKKRHQREREAHRRALEFGRERQVSSMTRELPSLQPQSIPDTSILQAQETGD